MQPLLSLNLLGQFSPNKHKAGNYPEPMYEMNAESEGRGWWRDGWENGEADLVFLWGG